MRKAARTGGQRAERAIAQACNERARRLASGAIRFALLGENQKVAANGLSGLSCSTRTISTCDITLPVRSLAPLAGDTDQTIDTLSEPWFEAVNSATRIRHAEADPDLDFILDNPRFKEMIAAAKKRLGIKGDAGQAPPSRHSAPPSAPNLPPGFDPFQPLAARSPSDRKRTPAATSMPSPSAC